MLTADGDGHLLRRQTVFVGTLDRCLVHPREVFAEAIADRAASVFLAHNHPSGNEQPSEDDLAVTRRLVETGEVMGIQVRDHVIVTRGSYCSFREHELLESGREPGGAGPVGSRARARACAGAPSSRRACSVARTP